MHQGQLNTHLWNKFGHRSFHISFKFQHIIGNDDLVLIENTSSILADSSQTFAFGEICILRCFVRNPSLRCAVFIFHPFIQGCFQQK